MKTSVHERRGQSIVTVARVASCSGSVSRSVVVMDALGGELRDVETETVDERASHRRTYRASHLSSFRECETAFRGVLSNG